MFLVLLTLLYSALGTGLLARDSESLYLLLLDRNTESTATQVLRRPTHDNTHQRKLRIHIKVSLLGKGAYLAEVSHASQILED